MTIRATTAITRDPEILGGDPVFTGTRVGVKILIDDLAGGTRIGDLLRYRPSVTRAQAIAILEHKRRGDPVVACKDGHARWISAGDVVVPDLDPSVP